MSVRLYVNGEVIDMCNYRADLWGFRSTGVVTTRTAKMQEKI